VRNFYGAAATDAVLFFACAVVGGSARSIARSFNRRSGISYPRDCSYAARWYHYSQRARGPASASVSVSDTGCGIHREHLSRVFDRFYRVDQARANSGQNVGWVGRRQKHRDPHGGHVDIDSEVGRGTEVRSSFRCRPNGSIG